MRTVAALYLLIFTAGLLIIAFLSNNHSTALVAADGVSNSRDDER